MFDYVRVVSVDALLESGFGAGAALGQVAQDNYAKQLNGQATYARSFGLPAAVLSDEARLFLGAGLCGGFTALSAFRIGPEKALSIALVIHGMSFFPVIAAGLYCLWRDKLTLKKISAENQNESGAPA